MEKHTLLVFSYSSEIIFHYTFDVSRFYTMQILDTSPQNGFREYYELSQPSVTNLPLTHIYIYIPSTPFLPFYKIHFAIRRFITKQRVCGLLYTLSFTLCFSLFLFLSLKLPVCVTLLEKPLETI